jgi:hypothetical protein
VRERDLLGQWVVRWQVIRTSNAYVFRDPKPGLPCGFSCKSENPTGTLIQEVLYLELAPSPNPNSPLERALDPVRRSTRHQRRHQTRERDGRSHLIRNCP